MDFPDTLCPWAGRVFCSTQPDAMTPSLRCWRNHLLLGWPRGAPTYMVSAPKPLSCYLLLGVWGKVRPVLQRLQPKPLPGLVVGG